MLPAGINDNSRFNGKSNSVGQDKEAQGHLIEKCQSVISEIEGYLAEAFYEPPVSQNLEVEEKVLYEIPMKYVESEVEVADGGGQDSPSPLDVSSKLANCSCEEHDKNSNFVYEDLDDLENELGEIYGYYELDSLSYNFEVFESYKERKNIQEWFPEKWNNKVNFVNDILDNLEMADEYKRSDALLALSYMMQGCWKHCQTETEQLECICDNVALMLKCDGFWRVWDAFNGAMRKIVTAADPPGTWGVNERIASNCLNILCTMTHVALNRQQTVEEFLAEIQSENGDAMLRTVFSTFVGNVMKLSCRSFLLKKLLCLARNLILLNVGGSEDLIRIKDKCRRAAGLKPVTEETVSTCRNIPILQRSGAWIDIQDHIMTLEELGEHMKDSEESAKRDSRKYLPWSPKSSLGVLGSCMKDCNHFKVEPRYKIPVTIQQRVNNLTNNLHVSLSTFHLEEERLIQKYPKALADMDKPYVERTDKLFFAIQPIAEEIVNAMMMVLEVATPVINPAQLNFNNCRPSPAFLPNYGGDEAHYLEDSVREAEIIVKAISAILILLLKHTKINHIYQFECLAAEIATASFIPTVLRFFNHNVKRNVCQSPTLQHPDSPFKAINIELSLGLSLKDFSYYETCGLLGLSWRKMFSFINFLRILNKIVKGKPARILMLRMFNAHLCWQECLNVKDSLFQQYVLKLLKLQVKYMDNSWKLNNQRIISAIYLKVRHRIMEDWIGEITSSNKMKKRLENKKPLKWPWDFKKDEVDLHQKIISYLTRRYGLRRDVDEVSDEPNNAEFCSDHDLPESAKKNYTRWMEEEVLAKNINWDDLLCTSSVL